MNNFPWYDKQVLGSDTISKFMKVLSDDAKLQGTYTNHCIRKTVIQTLDDEGFETRHIMALSSHKSETTIKEYATKCPESKKHEMYDALSKQLRPGKKAKPSSMVSKPQQNEPNINLQPENMDLPNFNLVELDDNDIQDDVLLKYLEETDDILQPLNDKTSHQNQIVPTTTQSTSVKNVCQTLNSSKRQFLPTMNFPNCSVTINYNFYGNKKQ